MNRRNPFTLIELLAVLPIDTTLPSAPPAYE